MDVHPSVCWSVTIVSPANTAEAIEMYFGMMCTPVGPGKHVLDGGCALAEPGEYDCTVHVRRRCGLFVELLSPLVIIVKLVCRTSYK